MELVKITKENLENEHICCAISSNKDCQVMSKKAWLSDRLDDGLVFLKGDVRGKCFIEYIPAEAAWSPIVAPGYMYIDCFWVSGQFKGQGHSNTLLQACIDDCKSKGKKGMVVLSSKKKQGYLSDPKYLKYKGFKVADTAEPIFELLYLPFDENATEPDDIPKFKTNVKVPHIDEQGFVLYYTSQCPFTAKYVPIVEAYAAEKGIPFKTIKIETTEAAQNAPAAVTMYCLFYNGEYVTNEVLNDKKLEKILAEKGLL